MMKKTSNIIAQYRHMSKKLVKNTGFLNGNHNYSLNSMGGNMAKHNENFDEKELVKAKMKWEYTKNGVYPYFFKKDNLELKIRVNDFPAEPIYTLIVNDKEVVDLESWPENWERPSSKNS